MANYQLYRSNVLLGGQMKYDVVLDSKEGKLCISDFHITPISNKCPYNKNKKDTLLNYPHQENIVSFYKNIKSSFYKDFADKTLTNLYPIPGKSSDSLLNTETTYEMGCRRAKYYQLYGKQFEFFCPVWLEHLKENDILKFKFELFSDKEQQISIGEKILSFKSFKNDTHDKFVNYLNDYLKYISCMGDKNVNDWVFNINKKRSSVIGLNVANGKIFHKPLNYLISNLISRERPVLETNNMIINELRDNQLIVKQLFNFNFCFNIEDILDINIELQGKPVYISVKVMISNDTLDLDNTLDLVDFYSNYEFIPKYKTIYSLYRNGLHSDWTYSYTDINSNVLDYLQDNKCINLIDKNKILQNTIHWNLSDYGSIFNFYDGFSAVDETNDLKYLNLNTPDINTTIYQPAKNQIWCNAYTLRDKNYNEYIKLIGNILDGRENKYKHFFSTFKNKSQVKNINIELPSSDYDDYECNVLMLINTGADFKFVVESLNNYVCYPLKKGLLFVPEGNANAKIRYYVIFINITDINTVVPFSNFEIDDEVFNEIKFNYLGENVFIPSSLSSYKYDSPSLSSEEIGYYKSTKQKSISRIFGKIKPLFITPNDLITNYFNYRYYKFNANDPKWTQKNIFNKFLSTNQKPLYPSINYWCFDKKQEMYNNILSYENTGIEYNYFNYNKLISLYTNIDMYIEWNDKMAIDKNTVYEYLINIYNISSEEYKKFILSKYSYEIIFKEKNNDKDIYHVKIKLN